MKHTIIIFVLSVLTLTAGAKTTVSKPGDPVVITVDAVNTFAHTEVGISDNSLSFSELPQNATAIYIMDNYGNVASSGKLSRKNNTVNIKQLRPGLYVIVLKQGPKVRMFGYHTAIVINGAKP